MERRKQKSLFTEAVIWGFASVGIMMSQCSVAKAGHWELQSVTVSGETTYPSSSSFALADPTIPNRTTGEWFAHAHPNNPSVWLANSACMSTLQTTKPGASLRMSDIGSATAHFVWNSKRPVYYGGQGGGEIDDGSEPDEWVFARVTVGVNAYAYNYYNSYMDGSPPLDSVIVSASNGYGSSEGQSYLDQSGEERTKSAAVVTTKVIQKASNGARSIDIPFPTVNVTADATSGPNGGRAAVSTFVSYEVQLDHRGLSISSFIETSYHKVDGENPPDLPEGSFRPTTPKSGPGPWAIIHERPTNGSSMQVTSALDYHDNEGTLDDMPTGWNGTTTLYTNEPGYIQPSRNWSLSNGTSSVWPASDLQAPSVSILMAGGGTKDGKNVQIKPSSVNLFTHESNMSPNLGMGSSYDIDWKLPAVFDKDLPWPANQPQFMHQLDVLGPLASSAEATESFPKVTVSYAPCYIQILSEIWKTAPQMGNNALYWYGSDPRQAVGKLGIILAMTFAPRISFEPESHSIDQNSEELFNFSKGIDRVALGGTGLDSLVPDDIPYNGCRLVEVMHHRVYKHNLKQYDDYDTNGYVGPGIVQGDTLERSNFVGRYVPVDSGQPSAQ